jgi:hypothetical protein
MSVGRSYAPLIAICVCGEELSVANGRSNRVDVVFSFERGSSGARIPKCMALYIWIYKVAPFGYSIEIEGQIFQTSL